MSQVSSTLARVEAPRLNIPMQPVTSQQVKAVGYDSASKTLAVSFTKGSEAVYQYPNVEPETYAELMAAESIGSYFGKHIKTRPFNKVAAAAPTPPPPLPVEVNVDPGDLALAVQAFQLAEQQCAERHAAAGKLIAPTVSVEAGLLAALRVLGTRERQAETALLKVQSVLQNYLVSTDMSKHDTLSEVISLLDPWPIFPPSAPAACEAAASQ